MGLDLYIRKQGKIKTNKKGQYYWTITELASLRNCWEFLDILSVENCETIEISGSTLFNCAKDISKENERSYVLDELDDAGIKNSSDEYYQVKAWW